MLQKLAISSPDENGYSLEKGLIKHQGQVWIGNNSTLQTKLIAIYHSSAIGGHLGVAATYYKLKKTFCLERDEAPSGGFCETVCYLLTV